MGAVIVSGGLRLATRRYQPMPAANTANAAIPSASSASVDGIFRPAGFVTAGAPTCSE